LTDGETSTTIMARVTNLTSITLTVHAEARDFGASPASASDISFYGNTYNPNTNPHTLQTTVSFGNPEITLAPRTSQNVAITLNNVDKLAPGGHYGAVLFSPQQAAGTSSNPKVSIHSAVATLIFLSTASGGTQTLQLLPLTGSSFRFSVPAISYIALKDVGNTQSAPIGQLTLYGPNGSVVSTNVINPGSGLILPDATRLFDVELPGVHSWLTLPGRYQLKLQYRDSTQKNFTVVKQSFIYINLRLVVSVLVFLGLSIFVLRKYGKRLIRLIKRLIMWCFRRVIKKKKQPPVEPPKPKRPRPLIQG
jgi:hypothetical protein